MRRKRKRQKTIGYPERSVFHYLMALLYGPRLVGIVVGVGALAVSHFWCETGFCFAATVIVAIIIAIWVALPILYRVFPLP